MAEPRTFVIVGAGLAGATAAETLRQEGFDGRVILLGAEPELPYERPPLSKGLLLGTATPDSAQVHDAGFYTRNRIEVRTGCEATGLDRTARRIRLADGTDLGYDRLLLATGASPRRLDVPGTDLDGVLSLRTLADAARLADTLTDGTRLVVIGAGWIGLEVAAAARTRGAAVTVVEATGLPLQRVLGDRIGAVFADLHASHGVAFRFFARLRELRGTDRVSSVVLDDGTELEADVVLIAAGVTPDVDLAVRAGLPAGDGLPVDDRLRTADPDVFAAGDIAGVDHRLLGARIRVEHWANALHTGPAAARSMMDLEVHYDRLPYFFSDQYDLGMEYTGWVPPGAGTELVVRGSPDKLEFIAFWLLDGRVAAGMSVNIWEHTDTIEQLARAGWQGAAADPARLADPDVPLADLVS